MDYNLDNKTALVYFNSNFYSTFCSVWFNNQLIIFESTQSQKENKPEIEKLINSVSNKLIMLGIYCIDVYYSETFYICSPSVALQAFKQNNIEVNMVSDITPQYNEYRIKKIRTNC